MGTLFEENKPDREQVMNSVSVLQWFNEHGIWIPGVYLSMPQCQALWKSKNNELHDGNSPNDYATKSTKIVNLMWSVVSKYVHSTDSILELGSNCGVNLNGLNQFGYTNLHGIEINKNAINEMNVSFPNLKAYFINASLENGLPSLPRNTFDLVFSMAVLLHIHPSSNHIFKDIVRVSKKYILTIEGEEYNCKYVFPRNYKRVFEQLECIQIEQIIITKETHPELKQYWGYTLRLFEKNTKNKSEFASFV